ncbi:DUF3857 domain-containing protein [Seonamhaeicola aphaedonensis]|uniref:Uncharacterized protein DUF3857 n=1 Tax=Seonamhaeicola aphaedonensis TaxID=1461338 RepID=A0A3D9HLA3_9FLAO|nr:DUF3857 domain-containing protein [Seonamhaeicola aphaedonensis]RED50270.1 uncharacterized protein DUF3857 [Seonamhaeicola aphaedonensis]
MRVLLIVFVLCFTNLIFSQDYKFGKVSKEELKETVCSLDSTANAAYLYKYRRSYYVYIKDEGFVLKTDIHERIKIYNQDGFDYATKQIRLYQGGSGEEKISNLKAYTYNIEKNKVLAEKLSKDGIFKSEASKYSNKVKFTMPNIKPGSVIEYKYQITSPYWSNVDEFIFQYDIPIKKLEAEFDVPEYYNFKVNTKGFLSVAPTVESKTDVIRFVDKARSLAGGGYNGAVTTSFNSSEITYYTQINKYNLTDIPALKEEPFVNSINNYRASAKYELSYTKFPNSTVKTYSTTWEDVVDRVYKSSSFGDELKRTGYFQNDIDALVGSVSGAEEKMMMIFDYVKSQVKWNGYYGFYADDVKKAYKNHAGSSGDINLMLTAMLRYAGLNANPVLVSTRTHGVPLFPTREGYNYVVSWVKLPDGTEVLLDGTDKYSVPNILPLRALNWQGRIVAENGGYGVIDLYPKSLSENNVIMMAKIDEEGALEGSYRSIKTNHRALSFRNSYNEADKDDYLEKLENRYNGIEISDYNVKNDTDLSKPIQESYKFNKESQVDIIGDKMYFSPLFHLRTKENPFKLEKREFPVDFGYPSVTSYRVILNIPEGYKIESTPESVALALPDNLGSFSYMVKGSGRNIQIMVETQINESIISPIYYEVLKEYFNSFIQKEAEQVVLNKKQI